MNIACPECSTFYRVNPDRVPEGGVAARCRDCGAVFRVDPSMATAPGGHVTAPPVGAPGPAGTGVEEGTGDSGPTGRAGGEGAGTADAGAGETGESAETPVFGPQDPDTRARRLARALVSDMKVYNLERWESSKAAGTLRKDFRDEIMKSWDEYVEQVGKEMAKQTPYFRNALNEILAEGEAVF